MSTYSSSLEESKEVSFFMTKVYSWMTLALAISSGFAFYVATNQQLINLIFKGGWFFPLIIAEVALVIGLSFMIDKMNMFVAIVMFLLYSAINGATLSVVLLNYNIGIVSMAFLITAGTFLFMTAYGYLTASSLSGFGTFLIMGLFGGILAIIVNFFLKSSVLDYFLSWLFVLIFAGLVAYDTQRIKEMGDYGNKEEKGKSAILGALSLYLDFVNLFLNLLRVMSRN